MHSNSSAQYLPQIATITSPVLSTCNRSANSLVGKTGNYPETGFEEKCDDVREADFRGVDKALVR